MNSKLQTPNSKPVYVDLVRGLSLIAAISVVVGNVIGTGVFLKARVMTCNVGTPGRVLGVYLVAGLLSLAGALTYAELATMMPKAGGEYVFMREAYGRPGAFLLARGADWSHLAMVNSGGACEGVADAARFGFGGLIAAMLGALWAYDGWNNVTLVAGEVQNPQRNLPRALIGGTLLIMGLYLLANVAYFYALSPTEIASISTRS